MDNINKQKKSPSAKRAEEKPKLDVKQLGLWSSVCPLSFPNKVLYIEIFLLQLFSYTTPRGLQGQGVTGFSSLLSSSIEEQSGRSWKLYTNGSSASVLASSSSSGFSPQAHATPACPTDWMYILVIFLG
jgi:hypothetical protein